MKKVLILFGGNSTEHYISCKSCKSVIENIDKDIFEYKVVGIDFDSNWYLFNDDLSYLENGNWMESNINKIDNIIKFVKEFDVVFPVTHGNYGEDGKLQGMLELFNIKFVGCKTLSSCIMMDKAISKVLFNDLGINEVPYIVINKNYNLDDIISKIPFPLIIKPSNGGSSIGISKATNKEELEKGIKLAKKYDKKVIIEKFIKARELEVAILEDNDDIIVSNIGEIKSANDFYDYDAKYVNNESYTKIADDLSLDISNKIKDYAKKIFIELGLSSYARIDFFYDGKNIYINEVNTIPGFTSISMYPILIKEKGISYKDLITKLINNE